MNDLNTTLVNVNRVLSGEKVIEVRATISQRDILLLAGAVLLAVFAGSTLAMAIFRK